jgi:acetyl-CoA C-acetyltransferase
VHPWAVVDSEAMIPVSRRAELHRSPSVAVVGERLAELTGIEPASADHLELYSCFPSAVQIQAAELGIDLARQLTVTGGMTFGGGPLNSAALHGVAAMVDVLRSQPGTTGLVSAVSGMLTKYGASVWSTAPPPSGFHHVDVGPATRAATATVEVDAEHAGEVVVEGATVAHDRDGPAVSVLLGRSPEGRRVIRLEDVRAPR